MKGKAFAYSQNSSTPNTFIGGVSATISTRSLLASKLAIDASRITNFEVIGSDIQCRIKGSYTIPIGAFQFNATPCIYYRDVDNLVISIASSVFYAMDVVDSIKRTYEFKNVTSTFFLTGYKGSFRRSNAEYIFLENCTNVSQEAFAENPYLKIVYIPRCTTLGNTVLDDYVFGVIPSTAIIYCHPSLATNNAGSPDGDIAYAITRGATVRYVTNFTAPSQVTTLATGTIASTTIQLNFTAPSSTNTIDYYECYANGVFKNNITASGQNITGLTTATNYDITIVAVDIFYNKSIISNSINVTTV